VCEVNYSCISHNPGTMEEPSLHSLRVQVRRTFKNGDLVQVCHGTGAYVKGPKTVAYMGRIEGYNEALGKWEVDF
jgi:hypothetical protein